MSRIVLGYAGGLGATIALHRLREQAGVEIVTVTMDVGQGADLEEIRDRALSDGARRAHVLDVREELARDWFMPVLRAGAIRALPSSMALARPLVARTLVDIAEIEHAAAVADGSLAGANVGLLRAVAAQRGAAVAVVAPARELDLSPVDARGYAAARRLPFRDPGGTGGERRLWRRPLPTPADRTETPAVAASRSGRAASIELSFERGTPVAINRVTMTPLELIASLDTIAGAHRIRGDAPAAVVLHAAHQALEALVMSPDLARFAALATAAYADAMAQDAFFSPLRAALDAFVDSAQEPVTGSVDVRLEDGSCGIVSCTSPFAAGVPSRLAATTA
jgi:argininosuccinate synthase